MAMLWCCNRTTGLSTVPASTRRCVAEGWLAQLVLVTAGCN